MFVVVKYGAEEEKIVNPNCLCAVLMTHIRKICGFDGIIENLDLASESGEVMDLVSKPKEYAKKFLEPRAVYILVKVLGDETDDSNFTYIPLLESATDKIKFSVTNPTFRQRAKVKGKGDPVKDKPEEVAAPKAKAAGVNKLAGKEMDKEQSSAGNDKPIPNSKAASKPKAAK